MGRVWSRKKEKKRKKNGAPTLILLTLTNNDFKISEFTFIMKDYENIYLSMSSVKIENSTLSLYIDDIGKMGNYEKKEKKKNRIRKAGRMEETQT